MVKNLIKMLLCSIIFLTTGTLANSTGQDKECNYSNKIILVDTIFIDSTKIKKDSLKNLMVDEVQTFINTKAPKAHKNISKLIVKHGLEHDIDIAFIMAQAQYETNFGTTGAGRPNSRYSLFGVNGKFKNYDDAISKYITLLKNNYLTKGKNEQHLLANFRNNKGCRYSSNSNYEINLKGYYYNVIRVSNIKNIQSEYKNLL